MQSTGSTQHQLLVIDDSAIIHRMLRAQVTDERIEVHSALTTREGLTLAMELLPDVILMDLEMPGEDGYRTLSTLKTDSRTRDIPVIVLSSETSTESKVRGLDLGAIDYVNKPFQVAELKARIRSAMRLHHLIRMLAQRARIDGLTGLWNRSFFVQRLNEEFAGARRHSTPLSLVMVDLDRFKQLNDSYGHPFGDAVLEEVARLLQEGRSGDIACRYGGEEFAIILPHTSADEARGVAERLREDIKRHCREQFDGIEVSASFGVADLDSTYQVTEQGLICAADEALYDAKRSGRDCVRVATAERSAMRWSA